VEFEEGRVTLAHAFTRLTRLAQILGGFVQLDSTERVQSVPGPNPKIDSLLQFIEELDSSKKVIIWARFTAELLAIEDALGAHNCVMYHGSVDDAERHAGVDRFQERAECRFFVGNAQAGRFGLTLTAASHVVYFSNNFSAETRWQSEDRAHRIGQTESVLYTDLIVPNTIDEKILGVLRARKSLADVFKDSRDLARWLSDSIPEEVT
jgi:SNF2 family DNA or RNA helicase